MFPLKSKVAVPKTEILEQPQVIDNILLLIYGI
jgi:hypothetical protein